MNNVHFIDHKVKKKKPSLWNAFPLEHLVQRCGNMPHNALLQWHYLSSYLKHNKPSLPDRVYALPWIPLHLLH